VFCVSERTLAFGAAEEFLCGSGRLESGLEPMILERRGVVLKGRMERRGRRGLARRRKRILIFVLGEKVAIWVWELIPWDWD
jgi:hypothetical protein